MSGTTALIEHSSFWEIILIYWLRQLHYGYLLSKNWQWIFVQKGIKDFGYFFSASRSEFLTKISPHTRGNAGWAKCLARHFAKLFPHVQWALKKARANARNIVGQQDATLLGATCCERLHTMLCVVATCWKLLDEVWNWSNFRANKCQHFYCFAVIEA